MSNRPSRPGVALGVEPSTRDSKDDLALLVATSPDALWLVDLDYRTVAISRSAARLIEYEPVELIGSSVDVLTPPDHKALVEQNRSLLAKNGSLEASARVLTKSGHELVLGYRSTMIRNNGERFVLGAVSLTGRLAPPQQVPALALAPDLQSELHARVERNRLHEVETAKHLAESREVLARSGEAMARARAALMGVLARLFLVLVLLLLAVETIDLVMPWGDFGFSPALGHPLDYGDPSHPHRHLPRALRPQVGLQATLRIRPVP